MNYFKEAVCFDPVNYYLLLEVKDLTSLKQKLTKKDIQEIVQKLESIHISYRNNEISVINKPQTFPEFDPKDYVSLATYYWPNPDTKNGLPYISRDGEANPEGKLYDKDKLRELAFITYYQGLLYYLTEDKIISTIESKTKDVLLLIKLYKFYLGGFIFIPLFSLYLV